MIDYMKLQEAVEAAEMRRYIEENGILDEAAYYGRNKKLIECEKQIQIIIDETHKNDGNFVNDICTKAFRKLENLLEAIFGFSSVNINDDALLLGALIGMSIGDLTNAGAYFSQPGCTLCRVAIFKYAKYSTELGHEVTSIKIDDFHSTVKLTNGRGYTCRIFIGAGNFMDWGDDSLTAREIMAVILHEIGHNFYRAPIRESLGEVLNIMQMMTIREMTAVSAVMSYAISQAMLEYTSVVTDIANMAPGVKEVYGTITRLFSVIASNLTPFIRIFRILEKWANLSRLFLVMALNMTPFGLVSGIVNYDKEKYADAFAAAHGYGADQASALYKINAQRRNLPYHNSKSVKYILSFLYSIQKLVFLPLVFFDEHPSSTARQKNMINYMHEVEVKKLPPALRREYEQELNRMEQERLELKQDFGFDASKNIDVVMAIFEDLIHLSDPRDITSTLGGYFGYKNLDHF